MKFSRYKLSIISLALVLLLAVTAFFGLQSMNAHAEGTASLSNIFTSAGGTAIVGDRQVVSDSSSTDGTSYKYYTTFLFNELENDDESIVYYRNRLAYHWMEQEEVKSEDGDGEEVINREIHPRYFNMEIGFKNTDFEKFVITFESQQYNKTEDGKTSNYVVFFPAEGGVYAAITDNKDITVDELVSKDVLDSEHINIYFDGKSDDGYRAHVISGNKGVNGEFKNVGGNYVRAVTSGNTTVYPLIFNAQFPESASDAAAKSTAMVLYSINGQEFSATTGTQNTGNEYYSMTAVNDTQPPVLCLEKDVSFFTLGDELDFDYVVIDVLRTSPSSTVYYYTLDTDKKNADTDFEDAKMFKEVGNDMLLESDRNKYLPVKDDLKDTNFTAYDEVGGRFRADMLVRVYVNLVDYSSRPEKKDVYLDWYVEPEFIVNIEDSRFMVVAQDKLGATYAYDGGLNKWSEADDGIIAEYQKKVDEAAKDLSAGSSSNFYLPSAERLFKDNATAYTDLKLNIYYYHTSKESSTNLATNNLSINVSKQGTYTFTIYATDAAGNNMYYLEEADSDDYDFEDEGKYYKYVEFASSKVWDMYDDKGENGLYNKLPWFRFTVSYKGVEFEETPGMQSTAYVGTSYSSASFKVNGVSGSYTTVYKLYLFDRDAFADERKVTFTYEEFIAQMDKLFNDEYLEGVNTRKYFTEIIAASDLKETDENYEKFNAYGWSSSSTTFTPQVDGFYYMRAEVTDNVYNTDPVTCSLAIVASERAKSLKGESDWLQNNVASVVLLAVAGVALIGIILLLVIKPKNKDDIDVRFEKQNKKKNN